MADKSLKDLTSAVYKIAENSPKIQKDVKDIRDTICGPDGALFNAIININKNVDKLFDEKKGILSNVTGTKSPLKKDYNKKLVKYTSSIELLLKKLVNSVDRLSPGGFRRISNPKTDTSKKISKLESISKSVEIAERLKYIKMKDLLFSGKKIKSIKSIVSKFHTMFKSFKNQKEVEGTLSLAESSIELTKKLSKIAKYSITAKLGAKTIESIFLGNGKKRGGILGILQKLSRNEVTIKKGTIAMKNIKAACTSMLIASIMLTGLAVTAVPAMLGALLMKGVVWLLLGTFKVLSKSSKTVVKGSLALLIMSTSVITFALGLGLLSKAVKGLELKDIGLMIASIAGVGLAVAGVGLLAVPIAVGSLSLLLIGASIGLLALSLKPWQNFNSKSAMGNIKEAIGGLRDVFGLELGKGDENKSFGSRLVGGIMDIAMGVLNFGKTFFVMGTLLLAGGALGLLYHGIKVWSNFSGVKTAISNIKTAVGGLKEVFGLETPKDQGFFGKLGSLAGGIVDMGLAMFQSGKALVEMGTITMVTGMSVLIKECLKGWANFDSKKPIKNMSTAINGLKDLFGLNEKKGFFGKLGGLFGGLFELGTSLLNSGKALAEVGTIAIAAGMAGKIRESLEKWMTFPHGAINNMKTAIDQLKKTFGLEDDLSGENFSSLLFGGSLFQLGASFIQNTKTLKKIGTIAIAVGMMGDIRDNLKKWEYYKEDKAISNIEDATNRLLDLFQLGQIQEETQTESHWYDGIVNFAKGAGNAISSAFSSIESSAVGKKHITKISAISSVISLLKPVREELQGWEKFTPLKKAETNISDAVNCVLDIMNSIYNTDKVVEKSFWGDTILTESFKNSAENIGDGLEYLTKGLKGFDMIQSTTPFENVIGSVNSLDVTKASVMKELFKSFKAIGNKPMDKFVNAVHEFSDSCNNLVKALDEFDPVNIEKVEGTTTATNNNNLDTSELADAIAKAIKSIPVNVRTDISDVKLVINNETGRRVVLTLDN